MKNKLVEKFNIYLEEDGKSVKTVENYVLDTSAFAIFLIVKS